VYCTVQFLSKRRVKKPPTEPRRKDRIAAILKAAEEVFVTQGYEAASVDAIARRANASKATIYAHFGNKMGLFEAIVVSYREDVQLSLHDPRMPAEEVLRRLGTRILELLLSPSVIALYRMMVAKGTDMPDLVKQWYAEGPRKMIGGLATFLAERTRSGELDVPDPQSAAEFFVMALRGALHLQVATGLRQPPVARAEIVAKVDGVVEMFLRAFARPSPTRKASK
jgi:TetR/AcrR family transcriptional repressor of mexJK operon